MQRGGVEMVIGPQNQVAEQVNFFQRSIQYMGHNVAVVSRSAINLCQTIDGLHAAAKLAYYVQLSVAYHRGNVNLFLPLGFMCTKIMCAVDGVRLITETAEYILFPTKGNSIREDWKNSSYLNITGNLGFALVNMASTLDLLATVNLINTSEIALSIGNTRLFGQPVLGFVAKMSLDSFLRYALIGSLVALSIDCTMNILKTEDSSERTKNALYISWGIAESAFQAYVLLNGAAVVPTFLVLGVLTSTIGGAAKLYKASTPAMANAT